MSASSDPTREALEIALASTLAPPDMKNNTKKLGTGAGRLLYTRGIF